jgi:beta-lactam-binding protein with PASTA domain
MKRFLLALLRAPGNLIRWIGRHYQWLLTAMAMIVVMLFAAAITVRIALHGHEVTIPDFAGMSVGEASTAALKASVDLNIENHFYSTTVPAGRILSQAPAAGSRVRHGWQVRVTESLGPQQVTIPDVVGQPLREASMNIRRLSLDLGTLAHIDAPGDPEMTLAQTPPPNAGVDQPRVNLLLSSSASASTAFVLPSFVGMSYSAANRLASTLGLRVALLGDVPAAPTAVSAAAAAPSIGGAVNVAPPKPATPSGIVTDQSPGSGFRSTRNDVIRLTLHAYTPAPPAKP